MAGTWRICWCYMFYTFNELPFVLSPSKHWKLESWFNVARSRFDKLTTNGKVNTGNSLQSS